MLRPSVIIIVLSTVENLGNTILKVIYIYGPDEPLTIYNLNCVNYTPNFSVHNAVHAEIVHIFCVEKELAAKKHHFHVHMWHCVSTTFFSNASA